MSYSWGVSTTHRPLLPDPPLHNPHTKGPVMKLFSKKSAKKQRRCGQTAGESHPCAELADNHTHHRCGHGDCSWTTRQ